MMTKAQKLEMYRKKNAFIEGLNLALAGQDTIARVCYEVYEPTEGVFSEFIVMHYTGGAYSVNIATGNSNLANLVIVANLANRSDYSLLKWYNEFKQTANLIKL